MMDSLDLKKMFGDGPYPFSFEAVGSTFDTYISSKLSILICKNDICLSEELGEHYHESYEFTMFSNPQTCLGIDKAKLQVSTNTLVQINSGQSHGPKGEACKQRMSGILIDKAYLHDIAHQVYSNSDFYFESIASYEYTEIYVLMKKIIEEAGAMQTGHLFMLDVLSTQMAILLLRHAKNCKLIGKHNDKPYKKNGVEKVIEYFKEHYDDNSYSFLEVADIANLSPYHLIRAFKLQTGKTPYEYLVELKINKAMELLKNKRYTVTEICYLCGFNNHSHFTTIFKRKVGMTPTEYRKEI